MLTDCGAARLLRAIFDIPIDEVAKKTGLDISVSYRVCSNCGCLIKDRYHKKRYCSSCLWHLQHIEVECSECGRHFTRHKYDLISKISKQGYNHVFCNRHCLGRWQGRNFGFAARSRADFALASHKGRGKGEGNGRP